MKREPALKARPGRVRLYDLEPTVETFADAVVAGLSKPQKSIPAKFFYDARGAKLFEEICALPEYYPTRTEIGILKACAPAVAQAVGPGCRLIEFGSGSARKVGILLDALEAPAAYVAIDISRESLLAGAEQIARAYPKIEIAAVCADYTKPMALPTMNDGRRLGFFPGSTIGNFTPEECARFLENAAGMLAGGWFLVGVDLKKNKAVLDAAYDDAQGVTAKFNLNVLRRANAEIGGNFDLAKFCHRAFYAPSKGRIEMHLVSRGAQEVRVAGKTFRFADGETIHTENSYKYIVDEFKDAAKAQGFESAAVWADPEMLFSVHLLKAPG